MRYLLYHSNNFGAAAIFQKLTRLGIILAILLLAGLAGCSNEEDPPEEIVEKARQYTKDYINEVIAEETVVSGPVEFIKGHYDGITERYVLEYSVETDFGSGYSNTPSAYIFQKDGQWHYEFTFGEKHEFPLTDKS